jgi:hypothetical protein
MGQSPKALKTWGILGLLKLALHVLVENISLLLQLREAAPSPLHMHAIAEDQDFQ